MSAIGTSSFGNLSTQQQFALLQQKAAQQAQGAAATGQQGQTAQGPQSISLIDGVAGASLIGGAIGAATSFILPFGPLIGGMLGSVVGAGFKLYKNYKAIQQVRMTNAQNIAAVGIAPGNQTEATTMVNGQLNQLSSQAQLTQEQVLAMQQAAGAQQAQAGQGSQPSQAQGSAGMVITAEPRMFVQIQSDGTFKAVPNPNHPANQ